MKHMHLLQTLGGINGVSYTIEDIISELTVLKLNGFAHGEVLSHLLHTSKLQQCELLHHLLCRFASTFAVGKLIVTRWIASSFIVSKLSHGDLLCHMLRTSWLQQSENLCQLLQTSYIAATPNWDTGTLGA